MFWSFKPLIEIGVMTFGGKLSVHFRNITPEQYGNDDIVISHFITTKPNLGKNTASPRIVHSEKRFTKREQKAIELYESLQIIKKGMAYDEEDCFIKDPSPSGSRNFEIVIKRNSFFESDMRVMDRVIELMTLEQI